MIVVYLALISLGLIGYNLEFQDIAVMSVVFTVITGIVHLREIKL